MIRIGVLFDRDHFPTRISHPDFRVSSLAGTTEPPGDYYTYGNPEYVGGHQRRHTEEAGHGGCRRGAPNERGAPHLQPGSRHRRGANIDGIARVPPVTSCTRGTCTCVTV